MPQTLELATLLDIPKLQNYLKEVELCMNATIGVEESKLTSAVLRLTRARGKRLRPALVIASALLSESEVNTSTIKAATAVELIHIGSLVHDDIIDKASTRWNVPTINAQEGLDFAILGGDFLFAEACVLAGEVSQEAGIIAAQTIARLCQGQGSELAVQHNLKRTETQVESAIYGKTAALMAAACTLGGICANQPKESLKILSSFGANFGMAFQLLDDVLDLISTDTLMGKPVGNDIKEGVYALPIILSLKGPEHDLIKKELTNKHGSYRVLVEHLLENGSIHKALERAQQYNRTAEQALLSVFGESAHSLARFPQNYFDWALSNLVAPKYKNKLLQAANL